MSNGCALFGKLLARRDFIALGAPPRFLAVWEPWLQRGLAASRADLGEQWQTLYLTTPIWRFWLGEEIAGTAAIGAIMPSMDGAGRCFPLTLVACADDGQRFAAPDVDPQATWFEAVETFLLDTLDERLSFAAIAEALAVLPRPISDAAAPTAGTTSTWWTVGGETLEPWSFTLAGLPSPQAVTSMLATRTMPDDIRTETSHV